MRTFKGKLIATAFALALTAGAALFAPAAAHGQALAGELNKKIHHELVTLPYYGIFDNLAYEVNGGTVTLYGQVTRPSTRSDAARRVARLPGVTRVVNNIEVLPLSSFDDQIRRATYRAIYGYGPLRRYALGAQPSIRIIVKNGNVTLTGFVANEGDRNIANIRANGVPNVFSVNNQLVSEK